MLSAGEAEVLHGRGVLSTDRLRLVTPDPPHAPVKCFDVIRQTGTEVCEPKFDKQLMLTRKIFTRRPNTRLAINVWAKCMLRGGVPIQSNQV